MGASYSRADASPSPAAAAAAEAAADAAAAAEATPETTPKPSAPTGAFAAGLSAASLSKAPAPGAADPWWRNFERSELPNPGSYDELSQDATLILRPNVVEGMMFNFTAPLSESQMLGAAVEMGQRDRDGQFALLANYFSQRLVCISRTTPADGQIHTRVFINHTPRLTSKIVADISADDEVRKGSWDLDYRGMDHCAQLKVASGPVVAASYLQSVAPWLALGGEGFVQVKSQFSAMTLAAKFMRGKDQATLSVASFGPIVANYVHRVSPKVAFATELFVDARSRGSHVSCGYRFDLKSATVVGLIDSSGKVAATLEEKINPALVLTLSGELDHAKEEYKFGFGVNIGGG